MKNLFLLLALLPSLSFSAENENDLNLIYQKVMQSKDVEFVELVKKSQRNWLKSRNESCKFFTDKNGNDSDLSNDCLTFENESRIKLLTKINSIIN